MTIDISKITLTNLIYLFLTLDFLTHNTMATEIERKFLVKTNDFQTKSHKKNHIKQGFLSSDKNRIVRIRICDSQGFITVKGVTNITGMSRFEWEKKIPLEEAEELITLSEKTVIEKDRYLVKNNSLTFEVDVFLGENKGLIIAEIELSSEKQTFTKPEWLGKEVTGKTKYYNSSLSKKPYTKWLKKT